MPKRMLDDSLLSSPSMARCSPAAQDAFPRFILLADDFGCFELVDRALVARGWPHRPEVTDALAFGWLEEYVHAGMAVLWEVNERRYCYLTGWDGEHGQRRRAEYDPNAPVGTPARHGSKRRTPRPPQDLVEAVKSGLRRDRDGLPPGLAAGSPISRPGNGGNAAGSIPNDFTPAREMAGNGGNSRETREPAAPVPDPVQVPVPGPAERVGRLALVDDGLMEVARRLGTALKKGRPLGVGKDFARVATSFGRWIETVGVEAVVAECLRLAEERGEEPSNLSWWPGWLDTVSDADLQRVARRQ